MDGQFYGDMLADALKWFFIVGIVIGIVVCGLVYGGYRLATHYRIKVEKRTAPISTVVTNTVTNYIYLPNTNK